jgi:hypothetical protein
MCLQVPAICCHRDETYFRCPVCILFIDLFRVFQNLGSNRNIKAVFFPEGIK